MGFHLAISSPESCVPPRLSSINSTFRAKKQLSIPQMAANKENAGDATDPEPMTGEVLFCGSTDWQTIGRSENKTKNKGKAAEDIRFPLLTEPHRLAPLKDVRIVSVATGCAAAHCLAVDADGRCYSWGRNECGQLGHGHQTDLNQPTIIEALAGHFLEIPRLPASLLPCLSGSLPLCPLSSAPYPVPASSKRIVAVASGRNHSLAVADDGSAWAWGSNKHGQLGTGSLKTGLPAFLSFLSSLSSLSFLSTPASPSAPTPHLFISPTSFTCSCALFLSSLLKSLPPLLLPPSLPPSLYFPLLPPFCRSSLFLLNPLPNPVRTEHEKKPVLSAVKRVRAVACGGEFSCWITHPDPSTTTTTTPPSNDATTTKAAAAAAAAGGGAGGAAQPSEPPSPPNLFTAGLPQYGQLGHGTDNEYNAKDSAVKLVYAPQPTPRAVAALAGREMCKVACGINHSVDAKGFVFTWGFGGFGRLGHKEQKDEWRPRLVDVFQRQNTLPPTAVVAAGGAFSACTAGGGQMYAWGKVKQTGDCWMYPKPLLDLSGWHIRSMACGATTSCVAADSSTISWGLAQHGELGYGPNGAK
ncbi:unnamed protein product [Closterium sp. NIES-65]|nr:unnamed protein product [Closterium sp. NIES-65]